MKQNNLPCAGGIQCIIPPHVVETIKIRGDANQRKMANAMAELAENARDKRVASSPADSFMAATAVGVGAAPALKRKICDGKGKNTLPGGVVRKEGDDPVADEDVNRAYDGSGDTYKLFFDVYQRNSLDGNGLELTSTIHHRKNYNNAFWNGEQMAYGDGDNSIFISFTKSLSVIGHELSHGVVQFSGGLLYQDQSGALNESFADVFGCLAVQYKNQQEAHQANWLVGDGILGPDITGEALRSMKAPGTAYDSTLIGKDPQPFHMDNYVVTTSDQGGVHINSGIPNHAFYLLSQYLGGFAWEKAGRIWYDTMQEINNSMATFQEWADKSLEMAQTRYGTGSLEVLYTKRAWKLVGVDI